MKTLVVILGPTGVGKTELTLNVARQFNVPVINADSRQIYKEIPIGTAAPTKEQQALVKHYFVGNRHIQDYYSAAMFECDVLQLLDKLFINSDIALMSGGSMMYIDAVCKGIDDIPTVKDTVRAEIKERLKRDGLESLCDELKRLDPEYWNIVDKKNTRRVVHAVEICIQTGQTYSSFRKNKIKQRPFKIFQIGLNLPREVMYERINGRVLKMIDRGLLDEVLNVYPLKGLNALNTVGYKELFSYIDGSVDFNEAVRQIQSNTRRYMRKQITWFKKNDNIKWFEPSDEENIIKYISDKIQ